MSGIHSFPGPNRYWEISVIGHTGTGQASDPFNPFSLVMGQCERIINMNSLDNIFFILQGRYNIPAVIEAIHKNHPVGIYALYLCDRFFHDIYIGALIHISRFIYQVETQFFIRNIFITARKVMPSDLQMPPGQKRLSRDQDPDLPEVSKS